MKNFDDLLRKFDLNYVGNGNHKISFDKMMDLVKEKKTFILDVRTKQENECVKLPFAQNIPIDEIPDRISEIPKDKLIAIYCSSATRATIVYVYLSLLDYDVRILPDSLSEIVGNFKPGYVLKNIDNIIN